jgi:hypothetical protein
MILNFSHYYNTLKAVFDTFFLISDEFFGPDCAAGLSQLLASSPTKQMGLTEACGQKPIDISKKCGKIVAGKKFGQEWKSLRR